MGFNTGSRLGKYGSLNGIADGLQKGLLAFQQAQREGRRDEREERRLAFEMARNGLQVNPDTGEPELTEDARTRKANEEREKELNSYSELAFKEADLETKGLRDPFIRDALRRKRERLVPVEQPNQFGSPSEFDAMISMPTAPVSPSAYDDDESDRLPDGRDVASPPKPAGLIPQQNGLLPKSKKPGGDGLFETIPGYKSPEQIKREHEDRAERSKNESGLRGEFLGLPTTKSTQLVAQAFNKIQAAAKDPSPAGDIGVVYGFMTLQDPGSSVKEGEYATAQNAAGVPERIRAIYNRAVDGKLLSPAMRKDFVKQAGNLYNAQIESQDALTNQYSQIAGRKGIRADDVTLKFNKYTALKPETAPPVGTVVNGFVFVGGDPNNENAWKEKK